MIILAGAERGIQGVSGPVVRSEDAATCRRRHRPSTSAPFEGSRRVTGDRHDASISTKCFSLTHFVFAIGVGPSTLWGTITGLAELERGHRQQSVGELGPDLSSGQETGSLVVKA